ncbi:hypothetical protein SELMODRAFT_148678 [Selaginella moellendorffii]|uniref:Protein DETOXIFICATION n=1 Tax=Selaginella moellendorffii TaxID=88036 RepID=D8RNR0_SELML|nr:protein DETOXIFICATION 16 [Selaginella moellendorffii]EFJ25909.1 hypothetical protein SELMODRAFT_148678 [Selaginella moellendorffii]|eukprot:XP_002972688.1 protein DETOXIFICATION 16 [Selaginella moellendorffii]
MALLVERPSAFWIEVRSQAWIALPMVGVTLLQFAVTTVAIMFVGHLGELELASAAIAGSLANVTGYSILLGLGSALETLCGQAYGAKLYTRLGVYLQRAVFVEFLAAIPIAIVWFFMEHVLLFFGQDPEISKNAGVFARYLLPELFAFVLLQPLDKFLQSQSQVYVMLGASFMNLLLNALFCWVSIYKLGMGIKGAALSASLASWINVSVLSTVVACTPACRRCWGGLSMEMFRDLKQFMALAIPSLLMLCLEWWSLEALVLLSGLLPDPQLETSTFTIVLNTIQIFFMIAYGLSTAASVRISNALGAGEANAAKLAFKTSIFFAAIDAVIVSTTLFLARHKLGHLFSNEAEVVSSVSKLMPFVVTISIVDAFQGVVSGVARGCGWQAFAAFANLGSYYAVGLPVAYVLAFVLHMNGKGLIIGILCGLSTQAISLLTIAVRTNWTKQAQKASERMQLITPLLS